MRALSSQDIGKSPNNCLTRIITTRRARLFQKISELDEYYLTSCEREIFLNHHHEIAAMLCDEAMYIFELGVGDGHKAMILLEHLNPNFTLINFVIDTRCLQSVSIWNKSDLSQVFWGGDILVVLHEIKDSDRADFVTCLLNLIPFFLKFAANIIDIELSVFTLL